LGLARHAERGKGSWLWPVLIALIAGTKSLIRLDTAVVQISVRLDRYPPGGIIGLQRSFETNSWTLAGKRNFHLDADNLVGRNLTS
jgi:hypothetical protein